MKISFPKKDGPKKGRKAPWQLNLAHGGRKYFRTRDLRVEAKTAMTQALHHGTFAEDYPAEARKLGFSEQEQGAIRLQATAAFDLFMKDTAKRKITDA